MLSHIITKYIGLFLPDMDKNGFRIFLESSPLYPNLLSVLQTLRYAGLDAQAGQCEWGHLETLATPFLLHLNVGNKQNLAIAKWDSKKECLKILNLKYQRWENRSNQDISTYWDGVVIYTNNRPISHHTTIYLKIILFVVLSLILFLFLTTDSINIKTLYYTPLIGGLMVSVCLYFKSYTTEGNTIDKLCHISKFTDCERVDDSKYSSLFGFKMNCLALSFFVSQLAIIVIGSLLEIDNALNSLYFISTVISLPTIAYSAYSQFKIRTICPLCAIVVICIVTEAVMFINWSQRPINPSVPALYCCIFLPAILISRYIWDIKQGEKEHQSTMIDLLKLKRKKEVMLSESTLVSPLSSHLWFGEKTSPVNVTTIISPKCSHCRKTVSEFVALKQRGLKFRWNIILGQSTRKDADIIDSWIHQFMTDKKKFFDDLILWSNGTVKISSSPSRNSIEDIGLTKIRQSFDKQIAELKISGFPRIILNDRLLSPIYTATDLEFLIEDKNIIQ